MENLNLAKIRVRIAPSPTGFVHVGNLRTILYNFLFAKHYKGTFIVRIEDTDRSRFVDGAMEDLLKTLEWAGLDYDEGPRLTGEKVVETGDFGPYIQSRRLAIYQDYIKTLLDRNKAYYCFCSKERLEELREDQKKHSLPPKYDQACRNLSKDEVRKRLAAGEPAVIRFRMPENKDFVCEDLIRGTIVVNSTDLDDFVLIKADGYPTYHFANIVDDHLMKITHVLRGDEWISSFPRHVALYEAFDWQAPKFAHLSQLLNKNKQKLSKRDGSSSVKDFIAQGYLKDALINFISLLGWNSGTEQEIYSIEELAKQFTLENVHKSGAVFDLDKLDWINGIYIRDLSVEEFTEKCMPYLQQAGLVLEKNGKLLHGLTQTPIKLDWLQKICALEQPRVKKLSEVGDMVRNFFISELEYDGTILVWKKSTQEKTKEVLSEIYDEFHGINEFDFLAENIEKIIKAFIEKNSLGNGDVLWPLRVSLSGSEKSPGPYELAQALGKEQSLARIKQAIEKLNE